MGEDKFESVIGYDCKNGTTCLDPDFCGDDGVCYERTCENVYRYAVEKFRGERPIPSSTEQEEELECYVNQFPPNGVVDPPCPQDEGGGGLFPIAVYYSCLDTIYTSLSDSPIRCKDWYETVHISSPHPGFVRSNRVCTAKPNPEKRFICYDIAPDTDLASYFEKYLQDVESVDGCEGEILLNNNSNNGTWLAHATSSMLYTSSWGTVLADSSIGETFDPVLAAALSINTMLIDDPTPSADSARTTSIGLLLSSISIAIISVSRWSSLSYDHGWDKVEVNCKTIEAVEEQKKAAVVLDKSTVQ